MQRSGLVTAVLLFWACSLCAIDIDGHWRLLRHTDDGNTLETFLDLKQQGSQLTGLLLVDWGDLLISDGSIVGNRISFTVHIDPAYSFRFSGEINGSEMRLIQYDPNVETFPVSAIHMAANEPLSPARLPLPALHVVEDNSMARTPPMGWNSWNFFHDKIDDTTVRQTADAIVATGMRDAGYVYVNIDDTWEGTRDGSGHIPSSVQLPRSQTTPAYPILKLPAAPTMTHRIHVDS